MITNIFTLLTVSSRPFAAFVAVIQHYLHTSLFTWMLVEGINLYIKIVKVFTVNKQYMTYLAVGWGKFAKCLDWNLMNTHMNFPID